MSNDNGRGQNAPQQPPGERQFHYKIEYRWCTVDTLEYITPDGVEHLDYIPGRYHDATTTIYNSDSSWLVSDIKRKLRELHPDCDVHIKRVVPIDAAQTGGAS